MSCPECAKLQAKLDEALHVIFQAGGMYAKVRLELLRAQEQFDVMEQKLAQAKTALKYYEERFARPLGEP